MLGEIRGEVRFKEPLAFHTALRIGGPADIFVLPQDVDDVRKALLFADKEKLPVAVLGGGHNVLVADRGFRGIVIKLEGCLGRMEFHGEEVTIGCGASLSQMIREAAALGLGGVECLVGIPATLGGALAMNAGTGDGAIGDFVAAVYFLHPDGTIGELKPAPGALAYRQLAFPSGAILLGVRLQLHRKPQKEILAEIRARLKQKKATQPLALASAGMVWKLPDADRAARLLERAGVKGKRIGGAEISAKHANFVINRGGATAHDVLALMDLAFERVHAQTGIRLQPELRLIGDCGRWTGGAGTGPAPSGSGAGAGRREVRS
jgi:UDP-N-acetylmuramate dehydrogenase